MLKVVYEAVQRLKIEAFEVWLIEQNRYEIFADFLESDVLWEFMQQRNHANLEICSQSFQPLFAEMEHFDETIQEGQFGPTAVFWQSFLEMVQILLDFIKSIQIGDWSLHLTSMRRTLPWLHAYDRINYARHFSYCWAVQNQLEITHPDILISFTVHWYQHV